MTALLPQPVVDRVIGRSHSAEPFRLSLLFKRTFELRDGQPVPAKEPEPVLEDMVEAVAPGTNVVLPTRFAENLPERQLCDVIVLATARSPRPVTEHQIVLRVGATSRRMLVRGNRSAIRRGTTWMLSPPEPWQEMPLGWDRAYGGTDPNALPETIESVMEMVSALVIDPGAYPRNDIGKGFLLADGSASFDGELQLPNLELPDDQMTPQRLACPRAAEWHRQPRPAGFGFVPPHWFPRSLHAGVIAGAWPDLRTGGLPEEELGLLPQGFLERQRDAGELVIFPGFLQLSAPGMAFADLSDTETLSLEGVDGEQPLIVTLPGGRPTATLRTPNRPVALEPKLIQVLLDLNAGVLTMLWSASIDLDSPMLEGIPEPDLLSLPVVAA